MVFAHKLFAVIAALAMLLSGCAVTPAALVATTIPPSPVPETATSQPTLDLSTATPLPPTQTALPTETLTPEPTATSALPSVIAASNANALMQVGEVNVADPAELDWSADGQIVGASSRNGVVLYDLTGSKQTTNVPVPDSTTLLDFSIDAGLMGATQDQKTILLNDLSNGSTARTIEVGGPFITASFSPDGRSLAVSLANDIAIQIYDTATGQVIQSLTGFETAAPVYSGTYSADGKHIIWVARGTVQVENLDTSVSSPVFSHEDFVNAVALSPDGSVLATATAGTVNNDYAPFIQLWNTQSGESLGRLLTGQDPSNALSFSPDGKTLASGTGSQVILWDIASQKQINVLGAHTAGVSAVDFSPDGRSLASASSDGTLRIWQVGQ